MYKLMWGQGTFGDPDSNCVLAEKLSTINRIINIECNYAEEQQHAVVFKLWEIVDGTERPCDGDPKGMYKFDSGFYEFDGEWTHWFEKGVNHHDQRLSYENPGMNEKRKKAWTAGFLAAVKAEDDLYKGY